MFSIEQPIQYKMSSYYYALLAAGVSREYYHHKCLRCPRKSGHLRHFSEFCFSFVVCISVFFKLSIVSLAGKTKPCGCFHWRMRFPVFHDFLQHMIAVFLFTAGVAPGHQVEFILVNAECKYRLFVCGYANTDFS